MRSLIHIVVCLTLVVCDESYERPYTHQLISREILRLGGDTEAPSRLVLVTFQGEKFNSRHFEMLAHLDQLREFNCSDVHASNSSLKYLKDLNALERIYIHGSGDLAQGFQFLEKKSSIKEVYLEDLTLAENTLNAIATLPNLSSFHLDRVNIHQSALNVIPKIATKAKVSCSQVSGISLEDEKFLQKSILDADVVRRTTVEKIRRTESEVNHK